MPTCCSCSGQQAADDLVGVGDGAGAVGGGFTPPPLCFHTVHHVHQAKTDVDALAH